MEIFSNSYFALFVIIALGYLAGRIKIRGLSLDVSAIIFVALIFGHYGVIIPKDFQNLGLVLFIFTIGVQAGPGFFESFKKSGRMLAFFATLLIGSAGLVTLVVIAGFGIDKNIAIGLLTGALTSTPGLAAAIDYTNSPLASIGYGVAYPFGVIGVILFVRLMPKLMGKNMRDAEMEYNQEIYKDFPEIVKRNFVVENDNVVGKSIGDLKIRHITQAMISRVMRGDTAFAPTPSTILLKGDIIKAVGTPESLESVNLLIGPETEMEIPLDPQYDVRAVLVTNKAVVNKTLGQINLLATYGATITRIRRSGIDFSPTPNSKLQLGDKLIVACSKANMAVVARIFGDDDKRLSDTDLLPVSIGIILGVLVGLIHITFPGFDFSFGLTGGVLIVALVLSRIGRTGPLIWTMSSAANNLLRQFGLILFLASVGTSAGAEIVHTFEQFGIELFAMGAIITVVPMVFALYIGKLLFSMNLLTMFGAITGGMTSTPGLAAADSMTDTNAHSIAYATVYPVAMVLLILIVQVINLVFH
jgi:putative transport protein